MEDLLKKRQLIDELRELHQQITEMKKTHSRYKKQVKEEDGKSKEHLDYLFNENPAVIYRCEISGDYSPKFISKNIHKQLGYTSEEFLADPKFWVNHIHPEDKQRVLDGLSDILEKKHYFHEYRFIHKNGSYRWMYDELNVVVGEKNEPIEIVGFWTDITEKKELEYSLLKSEEKLRSIVENSTDVIITVDLEGKIFFANHTLSGIPIKKIIGTSIYDYAPPEYHKIIQNCCKQVWRTKKPASYEIRTKLPNGKIEWFNSRVGPIIYRGKVKRLVILSTRITEIKEKENELRENEEKYRNIFENSPEAIALFGKDGILVNINKKVNEWLGYKPKEVIGKNLFELPIFTEESRKIVWARFSQRMTGKDIPPYELSFCTKDNKRAIGRVHAAPIRNINGEIVNDLVMISNITKEKELENKLLEQDKMAGLGRMAAVVSHELNTPLANIEITTEYLSSLLPSKYHKELKTIEKEVNVASGVIQRVLGFSHMDNLQMNETDVTKIVLDAVNIVQKTTHIPKKVFDIKTSSSSLIIGDEYRLREAFTSIIKNSVESLDKEKKNNKISIRFHSTKESVMVSITDTGIGMSKNILDNITQSFFTTKPMGEGTGLGLSITQWIIKKHEGNLSFESKKNVGTTAKITLPRKKT